MLKNNFIYLFMSFFEKGVGFLLLPLYCIYLQPTDLGIVSLMSLLLLIVSTFSTSIMTNSMQRFYLSPNYDKKKLLWLFFILLKISLLFEENIFYLYSFIAYGLIFYILYFFLLKKRLNNSSNDDLLIIWLNNQIKRLNIATISYHLGGWRIVYDTKHNRLFMGGWSMENKALLSKYEKKYPFLNINKADKIIDEYNLDYIFYNKQALDKNYGEKYEIPTNLKQIQISENIFALYK